MRHAILAALLLVAAPALAAPISPFSRIQARVDTAGGSPANGMYALTVRLFAAQTGGAPLYEQTFASATVTGGLLDLVVGPLDPTVLASNAAVWMEAQFGSETPLPRQQVLPVPYALRAEGAATADTAKGLTCVGCVTGGAVAAGAIGSDQLADGGVGAGDVGFNYAKSASKGGAAQDLDCPACVSGAELAPDLALAGDVTVTGSLTACTAGAPGCGLRASADGQITAGGSGWVLVQADSGLRVRSQAGSTWKAVEAGAGTFHGALVADGAATLGSPLTVSAPSSGDTTLELKAPTGGTVWRLSSRGAAAAGVLGGSFELRDATLGAPRLTVTGAGIGVGTALPAGPLHVVSANDGVSSAGLATLLVTNDDPLRVPLAVTQLRADAPLGLLTAAGDGVIVTQAAGGLASASQVIFGVGTGGDVAGNVLRVQGNGRIGVGTTSPNARLAVRGASSGSEALLTLSRSGGQAQLTVANDASGHATLTVHDAAGASKAALSAAGPSFVSGALGVGTPSPGAALDVVGGTASTPSVRVTNTAGDGVILEAADNGGGFLRIKEGNSLGERGQATYMAVRRYDSAMSMRFQAFNSDDATNNEPVVGFHAYKTADPAATTASLGALSAFTGGRSLFRFMNTTTPLLDITAAGAVGIGDPTPEELLDVEGNLTLNFNELRQARLHVASSAPAACDSSKRGLLYFNSAAGAFYGCNGAQWVSLVAPGQSGSGIPGTSPDTAAASCVEVRDGGGTASGQYWIDPNGGDHGDAFLGFCEQQQEGGGWLMLFNSVGDPAGQTLGFWQVPYAWRFAMRGRAEPRQNWYYGDLYNYGTEYLDLAWDLAGKRGVLMRATATGINATTMAMQNPAFVSGVSGPYSSQFAAGWASYDGDFDQYSGQCSTSYANVMQHYSACWSYNIGADANGPHEDGGWGPHVHESVALAAFGSGAAMDGSSYTRVNRIARFTRWSEAGGNSPANPAASCQALKTANPSAPTGLYWVDPNGGSPSDAIQLWCEMTLEGGGWALLYNSVGSPAGTTQGFWQFSYGQRLSVMGSPDPSANYYNGALYKVGTAYMDVFWDLGDKQGVAFKATATGINETTMKLANPVMTAGPGSGVYSCHFADGWASYDADYDTHSGSNCSAAYGNVAQHYCSCWNMNLGADADGSTTYGWGPHVHTDTLKGVVSSPSHDGSQYTRVNRIARFVKW